MNSSVEPSDRLPRYSRHSRSLSFSSLLLPNFLIWFGIAVISCLPNCSCLPCTMLITNCLAIQRSIIFCILSLLENSLPRVRTPYSLYFRPQFTSIHSLHSGGMPSIVVTSLHTTALSTTFFAQTNLLAMTIMLRERMCRALSFVNLYLILCKKSFP